MPTKYEWMTVEVDGSGPKPKCILTEGLAPFLGELEDQGWEIFSLHPRGDVSSRWAVVARRPRA